ncbi:MAG: bifunctional glutamate N-acetyltransferase/amino-acid acetyltransferase ArgJ [Burkholderia sp.]|nr:bifunctional glutamate N-acetyltransferase/amino-acid acetyltransferase ArgJ [Burkholderia sp.]
MVLSNDFLHPLGFKTLTGNIGIKGTSDDFACVFSTVPCIVSGMFSQNRFIGPSIKISQQNLSNGKPRSIFIISKNANVATGKEGIANAIELVKRMAEKLKIRKQDILIASTGIIGHQYPMSKIRTFIDHLEPESAKSNLVSVAAAIMTTDTVLKYVCARVNKATIVGVAKGVGMIEPNMATMLAFFFTDADLPKVPLDRIFRKVVNRTFNCLSIDTDTSTSDTAVIFSNGLAGNVVETEFEATLYELSIALVKKIVRDGEGATKMLEVSVIGARDDKQAKRVGKSIINSPLVKTAVHGADPNWGRVVMAIGKCEKDTDIVLDNLNISFGDIEVYPKALSGLDIERLSKLMSGEHINITVNLGCGHGSMTVWGCDLSSKYIQINSDYST